MATQISTPRVIATAVVKKTTINTPRIIATVVPSNDRKFFFDTDVHIIANVTRNFDTSLKFEKKNCYFDTRVRTSAEETNHYDVSIISRAETVRFFDVSVKSMDTEITAHFDTVLSIPHDTTFVVPNDAGTPFRPLAQRSNPGMVSMSIELNEMSLSDSFSLETTKELNVLDSIEGRILDFDYRYVVSETEQQDMTVSARGMYDVDALLYQPITYSGGRTKQRLSQHMESIASALGKKLNFSAGDFTHTGTWVGDGQTYESIITTLFGWSSSVPHKQINVFMRAGDNSINVVQRGYERRTTDITDTHHTRATYTRSLERTMWTSGNNSTGGSGSGHSLYVEPLPFWGTLTFGDALCSYESGYLVSEESNGSISTYEYTGDGFGENRYLSRKVINHTDGSVTDIRYDYNKGKGGVLILGTETETTTDSKGNSTVRKTIHAPLGNGFYGTSVYIDGEFQGSSIGTGSPAATASRYLRNQEAITLGGPQYDDSNVGGSLDYLKSCDFPIEEKDIVRGYLNDLKWLNRKIRETVTMDIYEYGHVIDFTERVRFKGHEYYLVSNNIRQTTTELKQSIQLVRWY